MSVSFAGSKKAADGYYRPCYTTADCPANQNSCTVSQECDMNSDPMYKVFNRHPEAFRDMSGVSIDGDGYVVPKASMDTMLASPFGKDFVMVNYYSDTHARIPTSDAEAAQLTDPSWFKQAESEACLRIDPCTPAMQTAGMCCKSMELPPLQTSSTSATPIIDQIRQLNQEFAAQAENLRVTADTAEESYKERLDQLNRVITQKYNVLQESVDRTKVLQEERLDAQKKNWPAFWRYIIYVVIALVVLGIIVAIWAAVERSSK